MWRSTVVERPVDDRIREADNTLGRKTHPVTKLTKKVGQAAPTGKIVSFHGDEAVEVKWDDGHTSVISRTAVAPAKNGGRGNNH